MKKTKTKKTKSLLFASWLGCLVMLIGFFAFIPHAQAGPTFELSYAGEPGPLFSVTNLAPLNFVTKQITVKNFTGETQEFGLNLKNLLGTPDEKLAKVLTAEISRAGNIFYSGHLSELPDGETFLENIPAEGTYLYDIKVTMDDVGNEYQGQEVSFDLVFGWLEPKVAGAAASPKPTKGILGISIGPALSRLPEAGSNALQSVIIALIGLFLATLVNIAVLKLNRQKIK